ncbi:MAG: M23 family metallopeptidase, partial [Rhizomicrobium sp.]
MVWSFQVQRAAAFFATVLLSSVVLSGCVSQTPRTQLDWFPKSDSARPPRTAAAPRPPVRHHRAPPVQLAADCPPTPRGKPAWYTTTAAPPPAMPTTTPASYTPGTLAFAWPVSGPIISSFGGTVSGGRNDGINIATPYGAPIHAAAAGQISYAGNELRGYGNLVLIKHDDGYVTAYAHAERIVVNRGDYVAKGQIIGYAGQTGDVTSPQLHFEIRKGVQPVNPKLLLVASRSS